VQKSRLVEKIAELLNDKKLPLVDNVHDESAEDIRLVIDPKSRAVDPELLMESLFRLTELESRIPLNLNVLVKGRIPRVVGLAEALREWLDHLRDVLQRRTNYRKEQIEHRLEVLGGYLIAYLNIDKVIKIIRAEDEPKPVLMKAFKLTDIQTDAILNMRLRSLRKLEEMELRTEDKNLRAELKGVKGLLGSEAEQWSKVGEQVRKVRDMFGPKTPLGKRRTQFADAPEHDLAAIEEAFVEREPVTVVISDKGWVRTLKGQVADLSGLTFKTDDQLGSAFFAETTSKLLLFATNGKFYSLDVAKLPGGRGHGEPIRMFVDMEQDAAIVSLFVNKGGRKFLVASHEGQGFVVNEDDCVGNTRKGKQVLNVEMPNEARALATVTGDTVAVIGDNRKMLLFPIDQVPEMARGRGVRLQKYRDGGLSDIATFDAKDGLTWKDSAGREFSASIKELAEWRGNRADAGRLPPKGFPKSNRFGRGVE
jgi:topoisomerase-4 subunit A